MQVCPVEPEAVGLVIPRLRNVDVRRLSGGATTAAAVAKAEGPGSPKQRVFALLMCLPAARLLAHARLHITTRSFTHHAIAGYTGRSAEVGASTLAPADSLTRKNTDVHVDAARARFLQRKATRPTGKRR